MIRFLIIFGAQYLFIAVGIIALGYAGLRSRVVQKKMLIFGGLALPITYVVAKITSHFYYDPRPFVVNHTTPLISHVPDNGFPSDHTLICAALAAVVYQFNKKVGAVMWLFTLLVGLSRVVAGVHHLIDIAGSVVIALVCTAAVRLFLAAYEKKISGKKTIDLTPLI